MEIKELMYNGFNYTHRNIDFGEEGKLITPDLNTTIKWFFTVRDGIFVQIKHSSPYSIVYEYFDGSSIINTKSGNLQVFLKEFCDDLDNLRNEINNEMCKYAYRELEIIILARIDAFISLTKTM